MKMTKKILAASMAGIMGVSAIGGTAVAVMNSGLVAFADTGDLRQAATVTSPDTAVLDSDQNNGKIDTTNGNATRAYYMGSIENLKFNIGAKLAADSTSIQINDKIGGFVGNKFFAANGIILKDSTPLTATGGYFENVPYASSITISGIAVYEGATDPTTADPKGASIKVTPSKLDFAPAPKFSDGFELVKGESASGTATLKFVETLDSMEFETAPDVKVYPILANGQLDSDEALGLNATADTDGVITFSGTAPSEAGKYRVVVTSKGGTLSVLEVASGTPVAQVAGYPASGTIATFDIVVKDTPELAFTTDSDVIGTAKGESVELALPALSTHFAWDTGKIVVEDSSSTSTDLKASVANGKVKVTVDKTSGLTADEEYTVTVPVKVATDADKTNYDVTPDSKVTITLTANDDRTVTVTEGINSIVAKVYAGKTATGPAVKTVTLSLGQVDIGGTTYAYLPKETEFNNAVAGSDYAQVKEADIIYIMTETGTYSESEGYTKVADLEEPYPVFATPIKIGKYTAQLTYGSGDDAITISLASLENDRDHTQPAPPAQQGAGPSVINANGEAGSIERILSAYKIDLGSIKNLFSASDFSRAKIKATVQKIVTENDITSQEAIEVFFNVVFKTQWGQENIQITFLQMLILAFYL